MEVEGGQMGETRAKDACANCPQRVHASRQDLACPARIGNYFYRDFPWEGPEK